MKTKKKANGLEFNTRQIELIIKLVILKSQYSQMMFLRK